MSGFSDAAKSVIAAIAPTLGLALGGPFGGVAGTFLANKLGAKPGDTAAIEKAITSGDPEINLKIQQAENDFKAHMAEIGLTEDKLVYDDKANARAREIAVKDSTPALLAFFITVGFFGTLAFMLWNGKPQVGGDALLVMLGSLGTAWSGIVAYYFGSSKGSDDKTKILADQAAAKK